MPFRIFTNVSFILIVAASVAFLAAAGWVPWAFAAAAVVLGGVAIGFHFRRRRGPQVPLAVRPRRHPGREGP